MLSIPLAAVLGGGVFGAISGAGFGKSFPDRLIGSVIGFVGGVALSTLAIRIGLAYGLL